MTIAEILKTYSKQLSTSSAFLDVELLLTHVLNKSREFILTHDDFKLNKKDFQTFYDLFQRRKNNEPIAYIIGQKNFFGMQFKVNKNTLIPRPETELLVEKSLELIKKRNFQNIIELGTGSGCITIALAKNYKLNEKRNFYAGDISEEALKIAQKNANLNHCENQISFQKSDLLKTFTKNIENCENKDFLIVANLPYLSEDIYNNCPLSVKDFEPQTALVSGKNGLDHYRKLFQQIKEILKIRKTLTFTLILEFSPEQKPLFKTTILENFPDSKFTFYKDLANKWRFVKIDIN